MSRFGFCIFHGIHIEWFHCRESIWKDQKLPKLDVRNRSVDMILFKVAERGQGTKKWALRIRSSGL